MTVLFISDLHLDREWPEISEQFFAFMRDEAVHATALYILGDLFETWIGKMVEGGGFEPPKAEPADLQSAPFGHSGTPPNKVRILYTPRQHVNSGESRFT